MLEQLTEELRNQVASQQAIHAAMYSALAVLKATDFCFLHEAVPSVKQHLDVLLESTTLPIQSALVYPWSVIFPTVYLNPWSIVPQRYLKSFMAPTQ